MIKLYSQHGCGMCLTIKRTLESKKIPFELIEISVEDRQKFADLGIIKTPTLQVDDNVFLIGKEIINWINTRG